LHLLRDQLSKENDPILNDLDSFDLVRAGLLSRASARLSKRPIRISTIGKSAPLWEGLELSSAITRHLFRNADDCR
jgi:hypothetical protein